MDISGALSALTNTVTLVKAIKDLDHSLGKSELKAKMADLYSDLAEVKMAMVDAGNEIKRLEAEKAELLKRFSAKDELILHKGYHYRADPNDKSKPIGHAVCPLCLSEEGIQMTLRDVGYKPTCPRCNTTYEDAFVFGYP
ncbi:hypothetical protein FEV53_06915 [Palleronia caenipelagi]|uniref:Uncharacterized protein n=2 Tax=Palleronia caenipelagi TaxID=2489174 RepID=A0A547Q6T1_9RHOB|nr:hypothetical protein FEV53_06915 [Palleronia caenipelagi]